jgi:hypothetical protein
MQKTTAIIASLMLYFGPGFTLAEERPKAEEPGFQHIFDGKSLDGWEEMPSAKQKAWSVQDGIIVGEGDKGRGYLVYSRDKNLADFELKFLYRFPGKGNSGVNIRARVDKTGRRKFEGYHADIGHVGIGGKVLGAWDFHTPGRREHRCFRGDSLVIDKDDKPTITPLENAVTVKDIKKGSWNELHVIAKGNSFQFFLNGKPSAEFVENLPEDKRLLSGMIQLQLHDPGMIVHYKNIRLKVLK